MDVEGALLQVVVLVEVQPCGWYVLSKGIVYLIRSSHRQHMKGLGDRIHRQRRPPLSTHARAQGRESVCTHARIRTDVVVLAL